VEVACDQPFARVTYEPTTLVVGASTPTIHERAVEGVRNTGREEVVYNGRVAEYHTYFVGDDEWGFSLWAHNSYAPNSGVPPRSGPLFQNPSQVVTTWVGELRSAIPTAQRGRITMAVAVVEDSNGVRSILVSSSEGAYVRGAVRPVVESMGAQVVGGTGHAEANIIAHAQANNLRVIDIGATRPVCVPCQDVINPTGANISTPLRPRPSN